MNEEFDARLKQISETIDQLRAISGKDRRELLDTLFRSVHSLKAAAQANGLNDLAARAHEYEDLLHAVRTGRASLDELTDFDHPQIAEIENMIPAEIRGSLKDEERHRLAECMAEGANLYLVETNFDVASFDRQFQQLREDLNKTGEVIATAPTTENGKINFRILYATKSDLYRILDRAMRAGRSIAAAKGKEVEFSIRVDASLDTVICDLLADPLMHLVRNAVDHGIDTKGNVAIGATTVQREIRITVADNGRGIDPDTIERMFDAGFSTAREVTTTSGRGVGLDVVKSAVEQLGGTIYIMSEPGKGSTFEIVLRDTDP